MTHKFSTKSIVIISLILAVALARIIPHAPNYSPMTALALFSAVHFKKFWKSILAVFLAGFLSDLVLNNTIYAYMNDGFTVFYDGFIWQYIAYAVIIATSIFTLKNISIIRLFIGTFTATGLFFILSNFGAWVSLPIYTKNMNGIMTAYLAGLPFLPMSILSDLGYTTILFSIYYLLERKMGLSRTQSPANFSI